MSNPTPGISNPSPRRNNTLIVCGVLFGVICFFAGRYTNRTESPRSAADSVPAVAPSPDPNASGVKSVAAPVADLSVGTNRSSSRWDDKQWQQILSESGTPARSAALAAMLEQLATADPDRAMTLARAERNLVLRESLIQAALHGWARTSPTNAAGWALALTDPNERDRALSTVFAGAVAASPEDAVRLGKSLIQQKPDDAAGCGHSLIDALCDAGKFEAAAHLAAGGDKDMREGWMGEAFSKWASFQPEQAAQAAQALEDPEARDQALHGIVGGWAQADPASLIQFVSRLPADAERGPLLSQSLERWVKVDPEAASAWINKNEGGPDLDEGVASVASMDFLKPDVAVGWAESVVNPKLRSETLVTVIRNWLTVDLPAAKRYFESTRNLLPDDRQELTEVFATFSNDPARP